eukprot:scaffold2191_cov254-Pinguiococcus_pyrenoidosus.AAC.3
MSPSFDLVGTSLSGLHQGCRRALAFVALPSRASHPAPGKNHPAVVSGTSRRSATATRCEYRDDPLAEINAPLSTSMLPVDDDVKRHVRPAAKATCYAERIRVGRAHRSLEAPNDR